MDKAGPIIIVEDDIDDQEILKDILAELSVPNEILFFKNAIDALSHLNNTEITPFILFSDFNLPRMTGVELKDEIRESANDRIKSVPFIFFTTAAPKNVVFKAYLKNAQGFFLKPNSFTELKELIDTIIKYWSCSQPTN